MSRLFRLPNIALNLDHLAIVAAQIILAVITHTILKSQLHRRPAGTVNQSRLDRPPKTTTLLTNETDEIAVNNHETRQSIERLRDPPDRDIGIAALVIAAPATPADTPANIQTVHAPRLNTVDTPQTVWLPLEVAWCP